MYKPIPFYFSNRGYGVFMHTAAPVTVDFGQSYIGSTRLYMADEQADLFIILGLPKTILSEYTALVGRPDTDRIEWNKLYCKTYKAGTKTAVGYLFRPGDTQVQTLTR